MLTISGTSLCTQDALNPCTAQHSTAHYCLEELKLLFWWFKRWIASGTGLTYPHRQKFPFPLSSVHWLCWLFFLHQPSATAKLAFSSRLVGVMWAAQAATAADTDRTTSKLTPQPTVFTAMPWSCTFCSPSGVSQSCLLLISCSFLPSTTASPALWMTIVFFFVLLSHSLSLVWSLFLLVHFHMCEYKIFHYNTSYPPFSDGVLLLLLSFSLAATIGVKWKAFYLIRNALNISSLVQNFSQRSPTLDGKHPRNWWLMPYIYVCVLYSGNYEIKRALLCI